MYVDVQTPVCYHAKGLATDSRVTVARFSLTLLLRLKIPVEYVLEGRPLSQTALGFERAETVAPINVASYFEGSRSISLLWQPAL